VGPTKWVSRPDPPWEGAFWGEEAYCKVWEGTVCREQCING